MKVPRRTETGQALGIQAAGRLPGAIMKHARLQRHLPCRRSLAVRTCALLCAALAAAAAGCGEPRDDAATAPPFDVLEKSIPELQAAMADGRVTSRELVAQYLARIAAYDDRGPALNAMIAVNGRALDEADALDRERAASGPRGPLHGIPLLVKDNFDVAGMPTTAGSIALAEWYPPDDAFQVGKLREAGAVIIGKANMHELAYGMTTVSSAGGQTRNPYDPSRNPGGSSGGTGAAVAANFAAAGLGTDTCGSIRMPSFHHALAGLRGTQGLSSRDGIVPLALTQDMGGPLAKTVTDLAIVLDATVGFDPADEATAPSAGRVPDSFTAFLEEGALAGARIGAVPWLLGGAPEDEPVAAVIRAALETMEASGAEVLDVELPGVPDLLQGGSVVPVEFKFQLADYLRAPGAPVKSLREILDLGLYHEAVEERYRNSDDARGLDDPDYLASLARRGPLRDAVTRFLDDERLDALAYPTLRRTAAPIGDPQHGNNCALSAVSGLPALVVPAGYAPDGMPVGLELLGRAWDEGALIRLAYSYEQRTHHRRAPATTPGLLADDTAAAETEWTATPAALATPADTGVTARVRFAWRPATRQLRYAVTVFGVRGEDVLSAHLHRGAPGETGPVVLVLPVTGNTRASGTLTLTAAQRDAFESGALYFVVRTREHRTGAARVQIDTPGAR